jgi:sugar fermentation stimulation protein A
VWPASRWSRAVSRASPPAEEERALQLPALTDGHILRRYKRFLADVVLADGETVTAHVPNTGSMAGCWEPGARVQLSRSSNPRRKLAWTLERVDMGGGWIGVHTGRPNEVMAEGIALGRIPPLNGYATLRREMAFAPPGHAPGRLDIALYGDAAAGTGGEGASRQSPRARRHLPTDMLADGLPDVLVEVKNVTLLDGDCLRFPDARSDRARKHLDLLASACAAGLRAVMLFALNRPEGSRFGPAWEIDPAYAERLCLAAEEGVELLAARLRHDPSGIECGELIPVDLRRGPIAP